MATRESNLRIKFFDYIFGVDEGYLCIATGTPTKTKDKFEQSFFRWPTEKEEIATFIDGCNKKNIWFGINLLDEPTRTKEHCLPTDTLWADLDTCDPELLDPRPQVVMETSPDRFQSLWKLNTKISPHLAEEYSKRIYGKYRSNGVDSGWALTKLLRVPFTHNFKYGSTPKVVLHRADDDCTDVSKFEDLVIEEIKLISDEETPLPDLLELPAAEFVVYEYRNYLRETSFKSAFFDEPPDDWSAVLWKLINICIEAGMSREETFSVAAAAKCNKYARDKRPIRHLWLDVVKASVANSAFNAIVGDVNDELINFPEIVSDREMGTIEHSFIDDYIEWASDVTDASKEYHELSGCILLSAMLADKMHLPIQSGKIIPNLWGLVLGESTLTRKTTAMDMAMDFVLDHDPSLILATMDSSVEGMFTALSDRSEKVSIYYRDEVTGFFDAMTSKSYLAGMDTTMTKLYDSPGVMTRQLRKETITVNSPVFIFFGGGILENIYSVVNQQMFFSGFMPRFLVVSGEVDMTKLRWLGPPTHKNSTNPRDKIKVALADFVEIYRTQTIKQTIFGQQAEVSKQVSVELTDEAWNKMRDIEQKLVVAANSSNLSLVALPTFTRLTGSLLKLSMLIAATRQEPKDFVITVELRDLIHAASFIQKWAPFSIDLMSNVGKTTSERELQRVLKYVRERPGLTKAEHMRRFHMQSLQAKIIFQTLEERGLITMKQAGRGFRVWPT